MHSETENNPRPPCPYCEDDSGECDHVIIDYDGSFGAFLSGYLSKDNKEIESFKGELLKLVNLGLKPEIDDDFLTNLWESASESAIDEPYEIYLDIDSYLSYLEQNEDRYDAISFRYPELDEEEEEDDEIPGQSSANIIFYSNVPEDAIRKLNNDILSALKEA